MVIVMKKITVLFSVCFLFFSMKNTLAQSKNNIKCANGTSLSDVQGAECIAEYFGEAGIRDGIPSKMQDEADAKKEVLGFGISGFFEKQEDAVEAARSNALAQLIRQRGMIVDDAVNCTCPEAKEKKDDLTGCTCKRLLEIYTPPANKELRGSSEKNIYCEKIASLISSFSVQYKYQCFSIQAISKKDLMPGKKIEKGVKK
jgi:hypothetical protein